MALRLPFALILLQHCFSLQCLNESGDAVDWFFVYKVNKGLTYSYYDAKSTADSLNVAENKLISDQNTAIGATLSQIWINENNAYDFIAYNVCTHVSISIYPIQPLVALQRMSHRMEAADKVTVTQKVY